MSPYVVGGLIGALGTIAVWTLTTIREHLAEKRRRREYDRTVLKAALVEYLGALESIVLEFQEQPERQSRGRLDQAFDAIAKKIGIANVLMLVVNLLRRLAYGDRPWLLIDRMALASAHLRLVAPPEVLDSLQSLDALLAPDTTRDERWEDEWKAAREQLRKTFRDALDQ